MREYLLLPGYQNSGPLHWQTLWEAGNPAYKRVMQMDWDHPDMEAWSGNLESAVQAARGEVILLAHSLGCLLVAHWAASAPILSRSKVKAAFLVGVVDPAGPAFPKAAKGFSPIPFDPLPFKSLVVASTDDPYASVEFALRCSQAWHSLFEAIGPKGHINAASGIGVWPEGKALLAGLEQGI
jgi:predicted alpha/beta hydrolase family esterase